MALAPWNVLAAGKIRSDAEEERRRQTGENGRTLSNPNWERNEKEKAVCDALEKVAQEIGARSITAGLFRHLLNQWAQLTPSLKWLSLTFSTRPHMYSPSSGGERSSISSQTSKLWNSPCRMSRFNTWKASCHLTLVSPGQ